MPSGEMSQWCRAGVLTSAHARNTYVDRLLDPGHLENVSIACITYFLSPTKMYFHRERTKNPIPQIPSRKWQRRKGTLSQEVGFKLLVRRCTQNSTNVPCLVGANSDLLVLPLVWFYPCTNILITIYDDGTMLITRNYSYLLIFNVLIFVTIALVVIFIIVDLVK